MRSVENHDQADGDLGRENSDTLFWDYVVGLGSAFCLTVPTLSETLITSPIIPSAVLETTRPALSHEALQPLGLPHRNSKRA
jgi:hypothetical protein